MNRPGAIGLTGGIACGKSEAANFLRALGVPVLDTDEVAHRLLEPGHWTYEKVVNEFGHDYVLAEGGIDRRKLGGLVFSDEAARGKLNAIVHPEVYAEVDRWLEQALAGTRHAVVMIPLLYETGAEDRFEKVIAVRSAEDTVIRRLAARGLTPDEARNRIRAQMPVEEKAARADAVIVNDGSLDDLKRETERIWKRNILGKEN